MYMYSVVLLVLMLWCQCLYGYTTCYAAMHTAVSSTWYRDALLLHTTIV